jgi:hypothetical protein
MLKAGGMILTQKQLAKRDKLILIGLYLSRFDRLGLNQLGFETFTEAFNVLGYALGAKPASIKNYRDEFDPLFPNQRRGWHKRQIRPFCLRLLDDYSGFDLEAFAGLILSFAGYNDNARILIRSQDETDDGPLYSAKRLITGLAAERYFESVQPTLPEFKDCVVENTTGLGCGYDFRLRREREEAFLAVEVKGLSARGGSLLLTPKEYDVALKMAGRFFLFVVKNFQEKPFHEIFQDPLAGRLRFKRTERTLVQISWTASV